MRNKTIFSKDFTLVAIGQIISIFGNQILGLSLPLYILNKTGSSVLFGSILAVSFIPMILLFPIGGIIADRVNKRNIMVILDFGTALLIAAFCLLSGAMDIVVLAAITMIVLCGVKGAYQPAVQASVPALVGSENLMRANSVVNLINSLASMLGPVLGGVLFSLVGLVPILYISIGCFFASAVMEIFIRIPFEKKEKSGNMFATAVGDLKTSFGFMFKKQPVLWKASFAYASVNLFLTSLVLIGLPVILTAHLGFAEETASRLYGYSQSVVAIGAILGGVVAGVLAKKLKSKYSPLIIIGCALSMLIAGIALQTLRSAMVVYIVLSVCSGLLVALSTLFQIQIMSNVGLLTPKELIGKVIACVICVCMCTNPLGQFIYGFVFDRIGSHTYIPFYIAALIMVGIGLLTRRVFYGIDNLLENQGNTDCISATPVPDL
ncbi:MFS transporter [Clostridia bacterium]|nr:MFS transporter [Clostridia bacterium]